VDHLSTSFEIGPTEPGVLLASLSFTLSPSGRSQSSPGQRRSNVPLVPMSEGFVLINGGTISTRQKSLPRPGSSLAGGVVSRREAQAPFTESRQQDWKSPCIVHSGGTHGDLEHDYD
jgi:hypothetical protein